MAAIGVGALVTMGAMAVTLQPEPAGPVLAEPRVDYGETSTQSTAPPAVETSVATPPVTAEPAPTEEPG